MILVGIWGSRAYSTLIPIDLEGEMSMHEMYNILLAIHLWALDLADRVVCGHCENESAGTVSNSGRIREEFLDICLRQLSVLCASYNIDVKVQHIIWSSLSCSWHLCCHISVEFLIQYPQCCVFLNSWPVMLYYLE